jgi:hypothetical protein
MSGFLQERYHAVPLAVNASYTFPSGTPTSISGFLCVTAGTITVTRQSGTIVINGFPCAAGVYYAMPFIIGQNGVVTLAGGASGTLGVS